MNTLKLSTEETMTANRFNGHQGDPCVFCGIGHDNVSPGPCAARIEGGFDQWSIQPDYIGFIWSHKDYDGPEDRRIGHSPTLLQCKLDIKEWLEEHEGQL